VRLDQKLATGGTVDEDVLDDGEMFDKLEEQRLMADDPDAVSFYRAKKMADATRRSQRANAKRRTGSARQAARAR